MCVGSQEERRLARGRDWPHQMPQRSETWQRNNPWRSCFDKGSFLWRVRVEANLEQGKEWMGRRQV